MKLFFEKFVINYQPYKWEIIKTDNRPTAKNKHSFIWGYIRFYNVYKYLLQIKKILPNAIKILDVGSFPGNMIKLSKYTFKSISAYTAIGLDLSKEFVEEVKKENVKCIDTEIDPSFPEPKQIVDWNINSYDLCLFLDTIEHLVNPIDCLDKINNSLKINGYLLITTDNITNFLYIADMLRKGKSPNVHPVLSSLVYKGNWRPHHKEYSKEELNYLLHYTGFELVKHDYFDRKQGEYFINQNSKKIKKHRIKLNFKYIIHTIIKNIGFTIPHLRNHHILLAKKIKTNEEVLINRKPVSREVWMKMRKDTIGY